MNKNERMEKLNAVGINTGKYFTINLDNGTNIHLIIDENGNPVKIDDPIASDIINDGYVSNTKLHRRFVMAQMFHALNYRSWDRKYEGYSAWLKMRGIKYAFDMMLEEIRVLSKLEVRDNETFVERSSFFTKNVIVQTMTDYVTGLEKCIDKSKTYRCKGIPYKKVNGNNIFVSDLCKKVYSPLRGDISRAVYARNYQELYDAVRGFVKRMPNCTDIAKSPAWIDAYKGEGAFYTLKNLIMFHHCGVKVGACMVYGAEAMRVLNQKLDEYSGEGWRMFAFMKKVIADNNFDFEARMDEIYASDWKKRK